MSRRRRASEWVLKHTWHRLSLPLADPDFFLDDEADMARRLRVVDVAAAEALLTQAKEMDESIARTAERIEARAMTLQGAVAVATTLALAAGALLLDATKVPSESWRVALTIALSATVVAFVLSGVRALGASSRTHPWAFPAYEDIFHHARLSATRAHAARTAAYLKCVGLNHRILEVKAGYLNAAVWWFRVALVLLLASAALLFTFTAQRDSHDATPGARVIPLPPREIDTASTGGMQNAASARTPARRSPEDEYGRPRVRPGASSPLT